MCGILAQINFKSPIDPLVFNTMRDTMTHRGPDGANSLFFNDHSIALGHRRLSIIDLTSAGQQPMCNEDESLWLTFNGEIYNYKSLRKELEAQGHQFASNTDSEVLLHGYEAWGINLVDRLKGMFAFCIWNLDDKSMFLARDRFGIKPLCYYQDENTFLAASELKAIVTSPSVPKVLNMKALSDYLVFRYVPSPHSIWKGIQKLPPASCMMIKADGSSRQWEYWKPEYGRKPIAESQAIEQLDHLLEKSVNEHLASDTPVGLLLSGGMDSSTIGHYLHKNGLRPNTFTVGFTDKDLSEHMDARILADQFETIHHELMLEDEFLTLVDKLTYFFDEPLGGTAFMPTYLVSKLASQHVKVVLGGHGGDEVFAGYSWFHQLYRDWYLRAPTKIKRLLKGNQQFFLDKAFQARSIANWHYKDLEQLVHPDLLSQMKPQHDHDLFLKRYNKSMGPIKNAQSIDLSLFNNEFGVLFRQGKYGQFHRSQSATVRP
jgi:asparagine synthase (glutamine-hydrolysing)